jgi:pimeloyl-ACP methyl ester carboxylesterase
MGALWMLWLALDRPDRVASMITMGCPALIAGTSAPLPMRLLSVPWLGPLMMALQRPSPRQVQRTLAAAGIDLAAFPELRDLALALERLSIYQRTGRLRQDGRRGGQSPAETENRGTGGGAWPNMPWWWPEAARRD